MEERNILMKQLIYGTAYYPEYEPERRTETDFEMMKRAGMNTIRIAESTWSTWEPEEGVYDFSILKDTLDAAQKAGMQVIVGTPTYAVPAWLVKKEPDVLATTKRGRGLYGPRQIMDIINPIYRKAAEQLIRRLFSLTCRYSCVIGYQLDNETKHYGTAGKNVQILFRRYLRETFGTVEKMNQAFGLAYWSNSIGKWEDLPDIRGTINGSLAAEFEKFQRDLAAEFLMWQRKIADEYRRPDQFITQNLDFEWRKTAIAPCGYSYGVQSGINHQKASEALTIAGCDIYHPTQDYLTGEEIAFCGDSTRSLKDAPYLVLETEAQGFPSWTPYPGQLRQQAFSHLASGAAGVEYWHWHSIHNGPETYWKGVLSHDMQENAVYRECMTIGADFKRLSPYLHGTRKKNRTALVVDNLSLTALKYFPIGDDPSVPGAQAVSYNDVVRRCYDTLYRLNIECDIIDVQTLAQKADNYDLLVTPALYCASGETISVLRHFVEKGGVLVSTFKSFFADEHVKVRAARQPYNMTDVFGMYYQEFTRPGKARLDGKPVSVWAELLVPDKAESSEIYDHPYWKQYAGITRHSFGKGYAVYIGCWCDPSVWREELLRAAERAGLLHPDRKAAASGNLSFPLILRSLENENGQQIHFLFNYSKEKREVSCPCSDATDILTGQRYREGTSILLKDWGTVILLEN